jgi:hypothetical protein
MQYEELYDYMTRPGIFRKKNWISKYGSKKFEKFNKIFSLIFDTIWKLLGSIVHRHWKI